PPRAKKVGRGCHGFRLRNPCVVRGGRHGLRTTRGTPRPTSLGLVVDYERGAISAIRPGVAGAKSSCPGRAHLRPRLDVPGHEDFAPATRPDSEGGTALGGPEPGRDPRGRDLTTRTGRGSVRVGRDDLAAGPRAERPDDLHRGGRLEEPDRTVGH